jgi:hypothetical protein
MTGPSTDELVRQYQDGESLAAIAAGSGLCCATVLVRLRWAGVKLRAPGRPARRGLPPVTDADLVVRYEAGETCAAIAAATGLPRPTVHYRLRRAGVAMRRAGKRLGHRRRALPAAAIAGRYRAGESIKSIGQSLGVPATTVRRSLIEAGVERRPPGRPRPTAADPAK